FNRSGVRYVVVGLSGINYYAKNPRETFGTLDYDLFLEPSLPNIQKAIQTLKTLGFELGTTEGPFKLEVLKPLVRDRKTLVATTPDGLMIELLLQISGYPFSELARDAATFTVGRVPIRVGRLSKLLKSKQLADRPKDRQFLKRYKSLLDE
ncbi:MAG: hypothetical protein HY583_00030, partial [Candidatus Omnitrophica bacterium]|nr:hypothetical protein [Candidatus Omnitrophota bacterium]